jgi:pheromone shutdown protein TraB
MTIKRIPFQGKEIILVGTAHISRASVELVEKTIAEEKPNIIAIELDESRLRQLVEGTHYENMNMSDLIQKGQAGLLLLNLFLANMQKRLGENVGVKPGEEMLVAVKAAQAGKIPILLADRDLKITFQRALASISFFEKLKLGGSIFAGFFEEQKPFDAAQIEKMKDQDMITHLLEELSKQYPKLKQTLVDERDIYLAHKIMLSPGKKTVAVVGAGHMKGIETHIAAHAQQLHIPKKETKTKKGEEIALAAMQPAPIIPSIAELEQLPKPKPWGKIIEWGIPLVFLAAMIYFFTTKGAELSIEFAIAWILAHGILAALGALLGGARLRTVGWVALTAWFAALHPLIAAGWIAAAAELKAQSPSLKDFTDLSELKTIGDFRNNRVTQILLITVLTNIGSMLAGFVILPYLFGFKLK